MVKNGTLHAEAARGLLASMWRIMLQALNVETVADLTSDEAFGIVIEEPEDEEPEIMPEEPEAPETTPEEQHAALAHAVRNYHEGSIDAAALVTFVIGEVGR